MFGYWLTLSGKLTAHQRIGLYSAIICLSGSLFGFDTGSIGSITEMDEFTKHFGTLSEFMRGFVVAVILLPSALTGIFAGKVSDKISRKYTVSLGCAIFALGTVIATVAPNLATLIVGRCIAGSGEGFFLSAATVYLCEICPAHLRATVICGFQLAITGALSLGFFLCYGSTRIQSSFAWRLPFICSIVTATFVAFMAPLLPYSPRWLVMHGRKEEANMVLDLLTNPEDGKERAELLAVPPANKGSYVDMFRKGVRGRVFLGTFLNIFQQLSGIDFVLFYAPTLFAQAGLSGDSGAFIASGVTGLMLVVATLAGTLYVDKVNRRTIVITGGCLVSFAMIMIGILYASGAAQQRVGKWFVILLIELFALSLAGSWSVVVRLYAAEIMPSRIRSSASSFGQGANQLINMAVALTGPAFLAKSSSAPYLTYGGLMAFGTTIAWLYMPETRGKSLESIDAVFDEGSAVVVKLPKLTFRGAGSEVEAGTTGIELRNRRGSSRRRSSAQDADGRELFKGRRGLQRLESDAFVPSESAIDE